MAHQGSFSSAHSSVGSTSPASSTSAVSVSASSPATVSFSVFQEGPGRALVFAPPLGTPELQALVDLFIALDVPVSMKMEMIQRDFEAHTARTNERYKTYIVPSAASTPNAASATITSPSNYTASPSPIFHNVFDAHFNPALPSGSGSGSSGSMYLDASPVPRPSPAESDLTVASDSLFPLSVPMFPAHQFNDINAAALAGNFYPVAAAVDHSPVAMTAATMWPAASLTATAAPAPRASNSARRPSRQSRQSAAPSASQQRRRLSGSSSMQILTRTGEDVTHMSSRGTRTHEERENTRLVRQRGACPDCRRKKTRCNPDHAGFVAESSSISVSARPSARAGPYAAPAQSGRAKAEAAAAKAAKASKAKVEGKRAVTATEPVFVAAAPQQAPSAAVLAGIEDGGGGGLGHIPPLDLSLFTDSFDWGQLIAEEDLELSIATTLSMTMPTTTNATTATVSASGSSTTQAHTDSYNVPPFRPPPPHRPTDAARFQSRRNLNVASATAAAGFANFAGQDAFAANNNNAGNDNTSFFGDASPGSSYGSASTSASDNFFGTVNASMTGSCVQPGSSQTGGLTHGSALRTLRPLLERTDRNRDLCRLDGDGDQGERMSERESYRESGLAGERRSATLEDCDREHDTLTASRSRIATPTTEQTRQRRIDDPDHGRLLSFQDEEQGRSSRGTRNRLQTIGATSVVLSSSSTSSLSSSSISSLSPSDALMLLTAMVDFAVSLLPAYQAWTAAVHEAEEAHDDSLDLSVQLGRMNLGPALVSCQ